MNSDFPRYKPRKTDASKALAMEHGKLPPQAVDLEEAVLGAALLDIEGSQIFKELMRPDYFYKEAHQRIADAIIRAYDKAPQVDKLIVVQELQKSGELETVGGAHYVSQLTNRIGSTTNMEYHSHIIIQKYIGREIIRVSSELIKGGYDDTSDVFDLLHQANKDLAAVEERLPTKRAKNTNEIFDEIDREITERQEANAFTLPGITTGFKSLDETLLGLMDERLIIGAARPGMGKTAWLLQIAEHIAFTLKKRVLFYSLEMSSKELTYRIIAKRMEMSFKDLLTKKFSTKERKKFNTIKQHLTDHLMIYDDVYDGEEIFRSAKQMCRKYKIAAVLVDYLQLMKGEARKSADRDTEIASISRGLKQLAKEEKLPVLALAQLNRQVENRGGAKRPKLSDLRESGAIEQDADIVIFLHRPEYYGIKRDASGDSLLGKAEIIIAKHRNGELKNLVYDWIKDKMMFVDSTDPASATILYGESPTDEVGDDLPF